MRDEAAVKPVVDWADRFGRFLMALASLSALAAFFSGFSVVQSANSSTIWVEIWRLFGFVVFAGMFALLAFRPQASAGVWELAFFHKTAMAVSALILHGAGDAAIAGTIDAILAILIFTAYVCTRGWRAWKNSH